MGIFVRLEDAFDVAVAALEAHRDYGNRESKAKARLKWLIEHWGLDKFRNMLEEKLGKRFERYEGQPALKPSDHGGVGSQLQKGYFYVNIPTRQAG
jgi:sulfite reductase beta subunit-like hemoprotein